METINPAEDSTKTRRKASTQPKPEPRQRLDGILAHKPSDRLGGDSAKNLVARVLLYCNSISEPTSSSSAARWKPENQTGCLSPSDGASCWLFFDALLGWGFVQSFCKDSAKTKHATLAGDSTKTRRKSSTQPKPEPRQRLDGMLAHMLCRRLGGDSAKNLGARIPLYCNSISEPTSSSSAARRKPEKQTGCLSPSDGASCWLFFDALERWGFVQSIYKDSAEWKP
jgi:hypothetical protein